MCMKQLINRELGIKTTFELKEWMIQFLISY